jgi:thioredoxin-dependent peroxiredoxin
MPEVGQTAPEFALPDAAGTTVRLSDLRGRRVVLYFYPKDATPGCTQEACDFRDRSAELQEAGVVLLGVSPDGPSSHQKFASKHDLPFPLLADTDHAVATAYGVWKQKSLYGRTFMGIERTTFLIDDEGRIEKVWPKVKVAGHAGAVLAAVKAAAGG